MHLLVCGDVAWDNKAIIEKVIKAHKPKPKKILVGDSTPVDKLTKEVGEALNIKVQEVHTQIEQRGNNAWVFRNHVLVEIENPGKIFIFCDEDRLLVNPNIKNIIFLAAYYHSKCLFINSLGKIYTPTTLPQSKWKLD